MMDFDTQGKTSVLPDERLFFSYLFKTHLILIFLPSTFQIFPSKPRLFQTELVEGRPRNLRWDSISMLLVYNSFVR